MRSATSTKRSVLLAVRWAGTMSAVAALAESSRTVVARCMFLACRVVFVAALSRLTCWNWSMIVTLMYRVLRAAQTAERTTLLGYIMRRKTSVKAGRHLVAKPARSHKVQAISGAFQRMPATWGHDIAR